MRRILHVLCLLLVTFLINGCSTSDQDPDDEESAGQTAPPEPSGSLPDGVEVPRGAEPDLDCVFPSVEITTFTWTTRVEPDVANDRVITVYVEDRIEFKIQNNSERVIEVSAIFVDVTFADGYDDGRVRTLDFAEDVGSYNLPESIDGDQELHVERYVPFPFEYPTLGAPPETVATGLMWRFADEDFDANCRIQAEITLPLGEESVRGLAVVSSRATVDGALVEVQQCADGGVDEALDATVLVGVTASGREVPVSGADDPDAAALGATELQVPVAEGQCRSVQAAFLSTAPIQRVEHDSVYGVPWRWIL